MKNKSLIANTFIYVLKVFASMVFPLITFPYVSRILLANGIGKYNFANVFVSYYSLLAGLGITTYAIREGAKIRDNKNKFELFACEMLTINICSMCISIVLLLMSVLIIPYLHHYRTIILILSITLPLTTLGTEWVFNVYEDFVYITIRSIIFQAISMILMFLFVKDVNDVELYAVISVIASVGSNALNFRYSSKYFRHQIVFGYNLRRHFKPIFILFASSVASQIYINSDVIMLGLMKGDYATGIYSAASKVYNIVRLLLSAVITIILPRLTYIKEERGKDKYEEISSKLFCGYISIIVPAAVGLFCVSKQIVFLLSGEKFVDAVVSLKILSVALIFSLLGSFIANTVLIVNSQEKLILKVTCIGAGINVIGNFFLIKNLSYNGAAIMTLVSESIVLIVQLAYANRFVKYRGVFVEIIKISCGLFGIIVPCKIISMLGLSDFMELTADIVVASLIYLLSMLLLRQQLICTVYHDMLRKIRKRKRK